MIVIDTNTKTFHIEGKGSDIFNETVLILDKILEKIFPDNVKNDFCNSLIKFLNTKNKMSEADKMLKELGYESIDDDKMEFLSNGLTDDYIISFWLDKTVSKCNDYGDEAKINMQELKAIIMKVKELGWYNE